MDRTAQVFANVGRATDVDLTGGKEHVDPDVDQQAPFDFAVRNACDDVPLLDRRHHLFPFLDLLGLPLAEQNHAFQGALTAGADVFDLLDQDVHRLARLRFLLVFFPLTTRDHTFTFVTHIHQDKLGIDTEDMATDDLVYRYLGTWGHQQVGVLATNGGVDFLFPIL